MKLKAQEPDCKVSFLATHSYLPYSVLFFLFFFIFFCFFVSWTSLIQMNLPSRHTYQLNSYSWFWPRYARSISKLLKLGSPFFTQSIHINKKWGKIWINTCLFIFCFAYLLGRKVYWVGVRFLYIFRNLLLLANLSNIKHPVKHYSIYDMLSDLRVVWKKCKKKLIIKRNTLHKERNPIAIWIIQNTKSLNRKMKCSRNDSAYILLYNNTISVRYF